MIINNWWGVTTSEEISYFKDYLNLIQETTKNNIESIKKREAGMKAQSHKVRSDGLSYWDPFDQLGDEAFRINEIKQLMLNTLVVGIFMFIEYKINYICTHLGKEREIIFSYKDIRGNSVKYLEKVLDSAFPTDPNIKKNFEVARAIRNGLVHSNSVINKNKVPIINEYIKNNSDLLSIDKQNKIELTEGYTEYLIKLAEEICDDLAKNIHSK
jgi:hypothetical protein